MATKTTTTKTTASKAVAKSTENQAVSKTVAETVTNETISVEAVKEIASEIVKEIVEPKIKKTEPEKKTFTDSDYILCRSVTSGGLNILSQSGNRYRFKDYGSECEINYRDLVTLIRKGSEHIFLPRFVILDEEFLTGFPTVQKVYGTMYTMNDLVDILDAPISQMKAEIAKLPEATKESMRTLIATEIANGKLDSIAKVRELSTIFDSDFNLLSDLFVK